ncbi:alpha/beta hydrolase fold domain-containing protein [Lacticaseibacillus kribbianus]|uniref:alpha/beta hydrolase fold domain-containing protein n=1 Tax=Lacticaseibacillus kribbianus TaxID=2926292 RepID=UPI001CD59FD5|nr:alpha/beta hydrolase fold domain-containing protein [Lacticaseibacillus kribbianus]
MSQLIATDVFYAEGLRLTTDLYQPAVPARGGIILIHGGGWFQGDKRKEADWAEALAGAGYFVMVPNYRLSSVAPFPAPLDDMATLMGWCKRHDLPFPSDHMAAVGASAGGNMAVELAIRFGMPAVSLSGILDIAPWLATHQDIVPTPRDPGAARASATIDQDGADPGFYKWFIQNYLPTQDQYSAATPAPRVTHATGPLFLANSLQEFVPMSGVLQMAAAASAADVPFTVRALAGAAHGKGYLPQVQEDVLAFLDATM